MFISAHNDDETLFGCYTLLKEKPLVIICTDSYIQFNRGDGITAEQRIEETKEAMKIVGCDVEFLHIKDTELGGDALIEKLSEYSADTVYAPMYETGGNPQHNLVSVIAGQVFKNVVYYSTYNNREIKSRGSKIITPVKEWKEIKKQALSVYKSQLAMSNRAYFEHKDTLNWESYK